MPIGRPKAELVLPAPLQSTNQEGLVLGKGGGAIRLVAI
jgi:hypothetical protein